MADGPPPSRAQCLHAVLLGLSCLPAGALATWFAGLLQQRSYESPVSLEMLGAVLLIGSVSAVVPFLVVFFWTLMKDRPRLWWLAPLATALGAFLWTTFILSKAMGA